MSASLTYDQFGALTPEEFGAWADSLDFSDGWEKLNRVKTANGAYLVRLEPVMFDGKPLRFADSEAAE